jgi:hypothetical protein
MRTRNLIDLPRRHDNLARDEDGSRMRLRIRPFTLAKSSPPVRSLASFL